MPWPTVQRPQLRPARAELIRDTGRTDAEIAALIEQASGHELSPDDLARYYTPADERHGYEG